LTAPALCFLLILALGFNQCRVQKPMPPVVPTPGKVVFAGVRSSHYGIKPFPEPSGWLRALETMSGYYEGSTPCGVWIVGEFSRPRDCHLFFPGDGKEYSHIQFDTVDQPEVYLSAFDQAGIKVFLQVEPAHADMLTLIDLVLGRYQHHPCVIGFGVDVEWNREADYPGRGAKVDDATARQWEAKVKSHNPQYRLFLKHWDYRWMPRTYRGDIIFVDDGQIVKNLDVLVEAFVNRWAKRFYPNMVFFQIGYGSDRHWWQKLETPPQTIGGELRKRIKQDLGIIWVDFTLREVLPVEEKKEPLVGVKIYDYSGDFQKLFETWRSLGINTAFVSPDLQSKPIFRDLAKKSGIATFIILPIFYNAEELKKRPDLYAITAKGDRAIEEWVEFVCPTREDYRREKIEYIKNLVRDTDPDGISLDFIRYFVFWEKVYPERTLESLPQTCFDASCLAAFQRATSIRIPENLSAIPEKANWIIANHREDWAKWKSSVIASMVKETMEEARKIKPSLKVNIHAVPWRTDDFGGAIKSVAGQDLAALAAYADYLSPMCYHHMVLQKPAWVHSVVEDVERSTHGQVLPSIQVKEAYISATLSVSEFKEALAEALKPPSKGVVFWSWDALDKDLEKQAVVRELCKSRN
jgi:hypothetical protein